MKNVLVTGATGFVGGALCEELLYRGYRVRAALRAPGVILNNIEAVLVDAIDSETD